MSACVCRHESTHAAGGDLAPHRHTHAYAALVIDGGYEEAGPDGVWMCEEGDLIVHPPFHVHVNRFTRSAARVINFTLTHAEARRIGADAYAVVRLRDADTLRTSQDPRGALDAALRESVARKTRAPDWLDTMAEILARDASQQIRALAQEAGVRPEHAARAFKRRFGLGPAAFRAEHKLRRSLQALWQTGQTLSEIAYAAGFADQSHFTRALRDATGLTPTALRLAAG